MARRASPVNDRNVGSGIKRGLHGVFAAALLGAAMVFAAPDAADEHEAALAALQDVNAAISAIDHAERLTVNGPAAYGRAAHEAINDLVGRNDPRYDPQSKSVDEAGALGRLNWLADRSTRAPWSSSVAGARVHVQAAVARLEEALNSEGLDEFQLDVSDALADVEMAVGHSTELGALGGLAGALANTTLGVPANARVVDGCRPPPAAPAYGVADGYLLYVAVPATASATILPEALGTRLVTREGDALILHTAAASLDAMLCSSTGASPMTVAGAAALSKVAAGGPHRADDPQDERSASSSSGFVAQHALYTVEQAQAGHKIYATKCVACHGENLQGTSAPSVAGNDFLDNARRNGWTLDDLRSIVVYNMPFNAPGSLSAKQYADVIAYLLAANCYPPGDKPFPDRDAARLRELKLGHPEHIHPGNPGLGTCSVAQFARRTGSGKQG